MRLEKLDLNLLIVFESLLETQSVSRTAQELNVSQPTISAALKRLRAYFEDELVVPVGRVMLPTPKATELAGAVNEMMNLARLRVVRSDFFDPARSARRFRIIASDYVFDVLLAKALKTINHIAPKVEFEILPVASQMFPQFHAGKVDLMITVKNFLVDDHPSRKLFKDDDVVIGWNEGQFKHGVTEEQFAAASFADAVFGVERRLTVSAMHFEAMGLQRHIAVQVSTFSALPAAVVGTNRLAVMHRKHAEFFKAFYPICLHELPLKLNDVCQIAQWHRFRENDMGIHWLLEQLDSVFAAPPMD